MPQLDAKQPGQFLHRCHLLDLFFTFRDFCKSFLHLLLLLLSFYSAWLSQIYLPAWGFYCDHHLGFLLLLLLLRRRLPRDHFWPPPPPPHCRSRQAFFILGFKHILQCPHFGAKHPGQFLQRLAPVSRHPFCYFAIPTLR